MRSSISAGVLALSVVCAVVGVAAPARADQTVTIEAEGSVRSGADARNRAIDAAFGNAVERAVASLVAPAQRDQHGPALRKEIVQRARLYVVQFRVLREREIEGQVQVRVAVEVSVDRLRERLAELGVGQTRAPTPAPAAAAGNRPRVVVLLHGTVDGRTSVSFGREGGDGGPAGLAVVDALRDQGFEVVSAAGEAAPVSIEAGGGLPMGDAAAADLARRIGAGAAVVVGVEVVRDGRIRGTHLRGASGRAALRVIDVANGAPVAQAQVTGAGFAPDETEASNRAAFDLGRRSVRAIADTMARVWPLPMPAGEGMSVRIRGATGWPAIDAIMRQLENTSGIQEVYPRGFRRGEVVLAVVTTQQANRVAAAAAAAQVDGRPVRARAVSDQLVEVRVE